MLDEKAERITGDLLDATDAEQNKLSVLTPEEIEKFFQDMSGRFTQFDNLGHTPCLLVRDDEQSEVAVRRGFELK